MLKNITLCGIFGLGALVFGNAQMHAQTVSVVNQLTSKSKGVWVPAYLPKSKVYIQVLVEKEEQNKGELSDYASQYFNLDEYIKTNSVKYKIADFVIHQEYTKDLSRPYFLQPTDGAEIVLNSNGVLQSINGGERASNSNQVIEHTKIKNSRDNNIPKPILSTATKLDTVVIREYAQDSTLIERRTINRVLVKNQAGDLAKETANKIQAIRDKKWFLISGPEDVHLDGKSIEISLSELEKMENELLTMFFGERKISTEWIELEIDPKTEDLQEFELGKFSVLEGWGKGSVSVKVRLKSNQNLQQKNIESGALPYYEPQAVLFEVFMGSALIGSKLAEIPQLSILKSLAIEKEKSVKVVLDSNTGALLRISK